MINKNLITNVKGQNGAHLAGLNLSKGLWANGNSRPCFSSGQIEPTVHMKARKNMALTDMQFKVCSYCSIKAAWLPVTQFDHHQQSRRM